MNSMAEIRNRVENRHPRKPFYVSCGSCRHVWPAAYMPMEMTAMAAVLKGLRCPNCAGAPKQIFIATAAEIAAVEPAHSKET